MLENKAKDVSVVSSFTLDALWGLAYGYLSHKHWYVDSGDSGRLVLRNYRHPLVAITLDAELKEYRGASCCGIQTPYLMATNLEIRYDGELVATVEESPLCSWGMRNLQEFFGGLAEWKENGACEELGIERGWKAEGEHLMECIMTDRMWDGGMWCIGQLVYNASGLVKHTLMRLDPGACREALLYYSSCVDS